MKVDPINAPIALFVYNRPWHTQLTVEALQANIGVEQAKLYVFSDGPGNEANRVAVDEVRTFIRNIDGFKSVTIVERETNWGLAQSIIDGVTMLCEKYGRVIVLEDDIVTSPYFLRFMNDALDMYQDNERVASIHGYLYPIKATLPETFFLRGADCWGWATWKRAWDLFEPDGDVLLKDLREHRLTNKFDLEGAYPFTKMLKDQIAGKNNSWAIRWHASAFLKDKLTLYPGRSLVSNIGTDSSGTHCATTSIFAGDVADSPVKVEIIAVEESESAKIQTMNYFKSIRPLMPVRILRKLRLMTQRMSRSC